ncbi:MAG: hypothetical protein PHF76_12325 [Bacteroidales bacterium]|nr:hypothetical protein [Bacteroidales bacterium]
MYIDPESGITISSNGSKAADSFMNTFHQVSQERADLKRKQEGYIRNKYGFVYYVEVNGWAYKCKQKGDDHYEGILDLYPESVTPDIGELLCVGEFGWKHEFVIYRVTNVRPNLLGMGHCIVYGEEVEEFSTMELV